MTTLPATFLASVLAMAVTEPPAAPAASNSVQIYRCVNSNGAVALRDSPCPQGRQQVLQRIRPQDPPAAPAPRPSAAPLAPVLPDATTPPRVVVVNSQPLFECTTPEGERYTADDAEGNPRWMPGPLLPVVVVHPRHGGRPPMHRQHGMDLGPRTHASPALPAAGTFVQGGGYWVRDRCQRLTRQEACSVLGAQRWDLISRYNSALQSERVQLVREQHRVEDRMEQMPCNG